MYRLTTFSPKKALLSIHCRDGNAEGTMKTVYLFLFSPMFDVRASSARTSPQQW